MKTNTYIEARPISILKKECETPEGTKIVTRMVLVQLQHLGAWLEPFAGPRPWTPTPTVGLDWGSRIWSCSTFPGDTAGLLTKPENHHAREELRLLWQPALEESILENWPHHLSWSIFQACMDRSPTAFTEHSVEPCGAHEVIWLCFPCVSTVSLLSRIFSFWNH